MKRRLRFHLPELPRITEARVVSAVFALAPWLTPLITAWLVFNATQDHLGWGWPQALVSAAIVETNGISATNLLLYLYRTRAERRLLLIAAVIVAVYAAVVLGLTVVLDTLPQAARLAPVLFVFLVLSSNVTVAVRAHHKQVIAESRSRAPKEQPVTEHQEQPAQPVTAKARLVVLFEQQPATRMYTSERLGVMVGCSDSYIRRIAHRNGDGGWVV